MAKKTTKKRTAKPADPAVAVIKAALALAAETPWNDVSLTDIAAGAKMAENDLRALFSSKVAILTAYDRSIDDLVVAQAKSISLDDPMRDRLFEAIMLRLDILQQDRAAVSNILHATVPGNPKAVLAGICGLRCSMFQMLDLCGDETQGLLGRAKGKALGLIYLNTLRVWLKDESEDLGKTMAALDKALTHAEAVMNNLPVDKLTGFGRRGQATA